MQVANSTTNSFYTLLGLDARGSSKPSGNPNDFVKSWLTVELANSVDHEAIGNFLTSSTSLPSSHQPAPCDYWNVRDCAKKLSFALAWAPMHFRCPCRWGLANTRMQDAGVHILSQLAVAPDLQRGWRNVPGFPGFLNLFFKYVHFRMEANPLGAVDGITQPRTALGFPAINVRSSGSVVVPSSAALSFQVKIFSFKVHFGLAFPFPNG